MKLTMSVPLALSPTIVNQMLAHLQQLSMQMDELLSEVRSIKTVIANPTLTSSVSAPPQTPVDPGQYARPTIGEAVYVSGPSHNPVYRCPIVAVDGTKSYGPEAHSKQLAKFLAQQQLYPDSPAFYKPVPPSAQLGVALYLLLSTALEMVLPVVERKYDHENISFLNDPLHYGPRKLAQLYNNVKYDLEVKNRQDKLNEAKDFSKKHLLQYWADKYGKSLFDSEGKEVKPRLNEAKKQNPSNSLGVKPNTATQLNGNHGSYTNEDDHGGKKKNNNNKKQGPKKQAKQLEKKVEKKIKKVVKNFVAPRRNVEKTTAILRGADMKVQSDGLNEGYLIHHSKIKDEFSSRTEKIMDVVSNGGTAFTMVASMPINPGNSLLFPNFNVHAGGYEMWQKGRGGIHIIYRPETNTASGSTVTSGLIMMAYNPDVDDADPTNSTQFEDYETSISGPPYSRKMVLTIKNITSVRRKYVYTSANVPAPFGNSAKFYDMGRLLIAVVNGPGTSSTILGEIHVKYSFDMFITKQPSIGMSFGVAHVTEGPVGSATATAPLGTTGGVLQSGATLAVSPNTNQFYLPSAGDYIVLISTSAAANATTSGIAIAYGSNIVVYAQFNDFTTGAIAVFNTSAGASMYACYVRVTANGNLAANRATITGPTAFTAGKTDLYVMNWSPGILLKNYLAPRRNPNSVANEQKYADLEDKINRLVKFVSGKSMNVSDDSDVDEKFVSVIKPKIKSQLSGTHGSWTRDDDTMSYDCKDSSNLAEDPLQLAPSDVYLGGSDYECDCYYGDYCSGYDMGQVIRYVRKLGSGWHLHIVNNHNYMLGNDMCNYIFYGDQLDLCVLKNLPAIKGARCRVPKNISFVYGCDYSVIETDADYIEYNITNTRRPILAKDFFIGICPDPGKDLTRYGIEPNPGPDPTFEERLQSRFEAMTPSSVGKAATASDADLLSPVFVPTKGPMLRRPTVSRECIDCGKVFVTVKIKDTVFVCGSCSNPRVTTATASIGRISVCEICETKMVWNTKKQEYVCQNCVQPGSQYTSPKHKRHEQDVDHKLNPAKKRKDTPSKGREYFKVNAKGAFKHATFRAKRLYADAAVAAKKPGKAWKILEPKVRLTVRPDDEQIAPKKKNNSEILDTIEEIKGLDTLDHHNMVIKSRVLEKPIKHTLLKCGSLITNNENRKLVSANKAYYVALHKYDRYPKHTDGSLVYSRSVFLDLLTDNENGNHLTPIWLPSTVVPELEAYYYCHKEIDEKVVFIAKSICTRMVRQLDIDAETQALTIAWAPIISFERVQFKVQLLNPFNTLPYTTRNGAFNELEIIDNDNYYVDTYPKVLDRGTHQRKNPGLNLVRIKPKGIVKRLAFWWEWVTMPFKRVVNYYDTCKLKEDLSSKGLKLNDSQHLMLKYRSQNVKREDFVFRPKIEYHFNGPFCVDENYTAPITVQISGTHGSWTRDDDHKQIHPFITMQETPFPKQKQGAGFWYPLYDKYSHKKYDVDQEAQVSYFWNHDYRPVCYSNNIINEKATLAHRVTVETPQVDIEFMNEFILWVKQNFSSLMNHKLKKIKAATWEAYMSRSNATPDMKVKLQETYHEMDLHGYLYDTTIGKKLAWEWSTRKLFLKKENLPYKSPLGVKPKAARAIQGLKSLNYLVILGPWFMSLQDHIKKILNVDNWACFTSGVDAVQAAQVLEENWTIIEDDVGTFDSSVHFMLGELEVWMSKKFGASDIILELMKCNNRTHGVTLLGGKYWMPGGRKSGDPFTSLYNTLLNVFLHAFILHKHYGWTVKQIKSNTRMLAAGDDNLMTINAPAVDFVPYMKRLGFNSEAIVRESLADAEFCSCRLYFMQGKWVLGPMPGKVLSKLGYLNSPPNDVSQESMIKGIATGLLRGCSFLPPIRAVIHRIYELTANVEAYQGKVTKFKQDFWNMHFDYTQFDTVFNPDIYASLYLTYGWTYQMQIDFECELQGMQLNAVVSANSFVNLLFDRDTSGPKVMAA